MKGAHTPGPWEVKRVVRFQVGVRAQLGTDCEAFINEANARLIAAAPDLLEFAQGLVDAWESKAGMPPAATIAVAAQSIVAKARGSR